MDYLKMIEFLTQELIKKDEDIKRLTDEAENKASVLQGKVQEFKAAYLSESDYVVEKEEEIGRLNRKIKELNDKYKDAWSTEFAYHHLKKAYEDNNSYYEERIAKLQVEINHLKNNN